MSWQSIAIHFPGDGSSSQISCAALNSAKPQGHHKAGPVICEPELTPPQSCSVAPNRYQVKEKICPRIKAA